MAANSPSVLLYSVEVTSVFVVGATVELCSVFVVVSVTVGWIRYQLLSFTKLHILTDYKVLNSYDS